MLVIYGFIVASLGSLTPSFLNLTVVKYSLKSSLRSALFLVGGFATILFLQANLGAYLANVLMENSSYLTVIQKLGTVILIALSIYFLRLHFKRKQAKPKIAIDSSKVYIRGVVLALLNTFAIPYYFASISFLIGLDYFEYSVANAVYFSIGSTLGSFTIYSLYALVAIKIEHRLTMVSKKINLILGCLTGIVGLGNFIYLILI